MKIQRMLRLHPGFPTRVLEIRNWPQELCLRGVLRDELPSFSIVGARSASGKAMRHAFAMAQVLSAAGYSLISGGALGVDAMAHRGCLDANGHTVAVMACGLDSLYPKRNQRLFEDIEQSGGAIVSPFAEGTKPLPSHFVRRNQIIAAMGDAVFVVEASIRSGSLHTARFALALGKPLGVMPGSPGCHALLAHGAYEIRSAKDALNMMEGKRKKVPLALPDANSDAGKIWACVSAKEPFSMEHLAAESGVSLRLTQRILLRMEMQFLVQLCSGRRYSRSALAVSLGLHK